MTLLIGSHHRPSDYRFARCRSDGLPLQRTPPPLSPARRLTTALLLALASFALISSLSAVGNWLL